MALNSKWLLAGIILMAVFLRFWRLDQVPPGYHYDEAFEGLEAWRVLTQPGYHPIFFTGNFGVEPLFIYLTALAFKFLRPSPVVQRGVAAAIGTLTVPALWLLATELRRWDRRLPPSFPLWSAAVQATLFWGVQASRIGYEPGLVPLLLCLFLSLLLRGLRSPRPGTWLGAGALCGLGIYTYPAGRLLLPVAAVVLALAWLRRKPHTAEPRPDVPGRLPGGLLLFVAAALLVMAPLLGYWWQHVDQFVLRSRQIAVVAGESGQESAFNTLVAHTGATLGMFSLAGDSDPRNNLPGRPVFDPFLAPFFYLGLLLALWSWRRLPYAWLLAVLGLMLVPTVFSDFAPHFRRALGALPAVALLSGLGLSYAWSRAGQSLARAGVGLPRSGAARREMHSRHPVAGVLLGLFVLSSFCTSAGFTVRDYFVRWAQSPDLFYAFDVGLWQLARAVDDLPAATAVYLTPRPATHTTLAFAWRNRVAPQSFDGRHIFVLPARNQEPLAYAVVEDEDFRSRLLLPELFPEVTVGEQIRDRTGKVYATVYRVPAGSPAVFQPARLRDATWQGALRLYGFTYNQARSSGDEATYRPGDVIPLRLYWGVGATVAESWTIFAHLLDADGNNVAGHDEIPGEGSYPTNRWRVQDLILDEIQIRLPPDVAPGSYRVEIGFYRASGERIAVSEGRARGDHIFLDPLRIEAGT